MFAPQERHSLLDMLQPPDGFYLDAAVGTTYSMDFVAVTGALTALANGAATGTEDESQILGPLQAFTRLSRRVRIYVDRGRITLAKEQQLSQLPRLYDQIVREVKMERGRFHPKVWVCRYLPRVLASLRDRKPLARLICASKNLTTTRNAELFVSLEGEDSGRTVKSPLGAQVAAFLRYLFVARPLECPPCKALLDILPRVQFTLDPSMDDSCEFLWQGDGKRSLNTQLPAHGSHALMLSPFVRKTFVESLLNRFDHLTLLSTQRELDLIESAEFHEKLKSHKVYVVEDVSPQLEESPLDLHAKLLICEASHKTSIFLGSANASQSAWQNTHAFGNCEAMLFFSPGLDIEHFQRQFMFDEDGKLQPWIREYERQQFVETDADRISKLLDAAKEWISRQEYRLSYNRDSKTLALTAHSNEACPEISQCKITVCPLGLLQRPEETRSPVAAFNGELAAYAEVNVAELSEFLVWQLAPLGSTHDPSQFVVKARHNFQDQLEARNGALLAQCLDKNKFKQFLLGILLGNAVDPASGNGITRGNGGGGTGGERLMDEVTLEIIMQACTEDPSRIGHIDDLLRAFQDTKFIDSEFLRFWADFKAACSQPGGKS